MKMKIFKVEDIEKPYILWNLFVDYVQWYIIKGSVNTFSKKSQTPYILHRSPFKSLQEKMKIFILRLFNKHEFRANILILLTFYNWKSNSIITVKMFKPCNSNNVGLP